MTNRLINIFLIDGADPLNYTSWNRYKYSTNNKSDILAYFLKVLTSFNHVMHELSSRLGNKQIKCKD